jgi:hypothetical protein
LETPPSHRRQLQKNGSEVIFGEVVDFVASRWTFASDQVGLVIAVEVVLAVVGGDEQVAIFAR